ncbi:hypothetical protein ACQP0C_23570 [Nocardia sp. CA-129566]|uniref:hypothetical protein n=1 Tax=Nocardia sp. CA-129566 TaxID=3239976 RepID=UPI003D9615EA
MTAFGSWGQGSLGVAQVGTLRVLIEHRILPDLAVGAVDAAHSATWSSPVSIELARLWLSVGRHDRYPFSPANALRGLAHWHPLPRLRHALAMTSFAIVRYDHESLGATGAITGGLA